MAFSDKFGNNNDGSMFGLDYTKLGTSTSQPTSNLLSPNKGSSWSLWGGRNEQGFDTNSIVGTGVDLGMSALDAYLGLKQLGVAEDALDFQKGAFSQQFNINKALTESQLRDRQRARLSANPTGYKSVEEYMKEVGI